MAAFCKIAVDRAAIRTATEKAVLIELPKGWLMWHALKLAYQHPDDPALFLVGYFDDSAGKPCFLQEGRKKVDERVVPWSSIARVTRGVYTRPTGFLAPLSLEASKGAAFKSRRKLGRHCPAPLEPLEAVPPHASLLRRAEDCGPCGTGCGTRALSADQRAAVAKFRNSKVAALFMACGTGKTQCATAIVNTIGRLDLLVWFCPCRCKENTLEELRKCGLRYEPHIYGIESMSASPAAFAEVRALLQGADPGRACIVLDESLTIKNMQSKRTRRILELGDLAEYKLILNGTPVTKNVMDIYAQMQFLSPLVLSCSLTEFKERYCVYSLVKMGDRVIEKQEGAANLPHLLSLIGPYTYTCSLSLDVGKEYYTHEVCLSPEEMAEYRQRKTELAEEYGAGNMGAVLAKLLHCYCLSPAKLRALHALLRDSRGRDLSADTIVFCRFVVSAGEVQRRYPKLKVLTYGKGSIGLNLQQYCRIIYFDKTWDYAFREQSEARIHRTGQTRACEYHDISTNTGIDRLIDKCIAAKQDLLDVFMRRRNILDALED